MKKGVQPRERKKMGKRIIVRRSIYKQEKAGRQWQYRDKKNEGEDRK